MTPLPFGTFPKIHPFLKGQASLRGVCLWQNICNSGKSSQEKGALKKSKSLDFVPTGRPPHPLPRGWDTKNGKKYFNVYFALQTNLSIIIFHENVPFFVGGNMWKGYPPTLVENLEIYGQLQGKFGFYKFWQNLAFGRTPPLVGTKPQLLPCF